jgi:hypothetical protein
MASMNYFDSDMYNSTNTVVYFDEEDGNLYLCLRAMSHTIYAATIEQKITFATGKSVLLMMHP